MCIHIPIAGSVAPSSSSGLIVPHLCGKPLFSLSISSCLCFSCSNTRCSSIIAYRNRIVLTTFPNSNFWPKCPNILSQILYAVIYFSTVPKNSEIIHCRTLMTHGKTLIVMGERQNLSPAYTLHTNIIHQRALLRIFLPAILQKLLSYLPK